MKNLPEHNFWNEIKDRLDHYAEEPTDDSWDKIAGALNSAPRPRILAWLERRVSSTQVGLSGFAFLVALAAGDRSVSRWNESVGDVGQEVYAACEDETLSADKTATLTVQAQTASEALPNIASVEGDDHDAIATTRRDASRKKGAQDDATQKYAAAYAHSDETSEISPSVLPDTIDSENQRGANTPGATTTTVDSIAKKDVDKKVPVTNTKEKKVAEKKKAQLHIPMVYFQVGPSLVYNKITPSTNDDVTITDLEESGVFASDRKGFSVEAGFQYRLAPRLEAYGGLSYYQQSQHIRYTLAQAASGGVTGNQEDGYVFTPVTRQHEVRYTMRNAGVSAGVFYRVKTHLLEHKLGVGLLYQQGFQRTSGEENTYTNKGSKYLQYQLAYRMEAGLNDRMRLYFQPSYTHAFHVNEKLNEPFTIKPYRAGISVGIVYLFGK